MNALVTLLISSALLLSGCSVDTEDTAKLLSDEYNAAMGIYQSGDSKAAEDALIDFRSLLVEKKPESPQVVDYDELNGIVSLRLYSLYVSVGRSGDANREMQRAVKLMSKRLETASDDSDREEQLKLLLHELEKELPPKWKASEIELR